MTRRGRISHAEWNRGDRNKPPESVTFGLSSVIASGGRGRCTVIGGRSYDAAGRPWGERASCWCPNERVFMAQRSDKPLLRRGQRAAGLQARPASDGMRRVLVRRQGASTAERVAAEWESLVTRLEERALAVRGLRAHAGDSTPGPTWTAPRIVAALGELTVLVGHTPTIGDLEGRPRATWPSPSRVRIVFGSWKAALVAAGLRPQSTGHSPRRVWSDEEILQAIQDAAAGGDPGEVPFREGRRRPRLEAIAARFGSWSAAESLALPVTPAPEPPPAGPRTPLRPAPRAGRRPAFEAEPRPPG